MFLTLNSIFLDFVFSVCNLLLTLCCFGVSCGGCLLLYWLLFV